jgi:hypothetical protein
VQWSVVTGQVAGSAPIVEGVGTAPRAVDDLVDDDELAGMQVGLQRADRARSDDRAHPDRRERPDVGPVRHPVRGVLVVATVTGHERDPTPGDDADPHRRSGWTVRRGDLDVATTVDEVVEARSADDPDVREVVDDGDVHAAQLLVLAGAVVGVVLDDVVDAASDELVLLVDEVDEVEESVPAVELDELDVELPDLPRLSVL